MGRLSRLIGYLIFTSKNQGNDGSSADPLKGTLLFVTKIQHKKGNDAKTSNPATGFLPPLRLAFWKTVIA